MGTSEADRRLLALDPRYSRLLWMNGTLPDVLTARQDGLTIVLRRDTPQSLERTIAGVLASDEVRDEIRIVSLKQPFTVEINGARTDVFLLPTGSFTDGKLPVGESVAVIPRTISGDIKQAIALDQRAQSFTDALNDPKLDLRPFVSDTYSEMADSLEDSITYLRMGVGLHKQALQNAVDIVQSKRLAFLEAGEEPNWSGVLFMVGFVFFIELAAIPVAAALIGSLIAGLSRVSPNAARAVIGATKAREIEKTIASVRANSRHFKALKYERDTSPGIYAPHLIRKAHEDYRRILDITRDKIVKSTERLDSQRSDVHKQVAELLKSGKGSEHLAGLAKGLSSQNVKTAAKGLKEVAGPFVSKKASKRPKQNVSTELPLDIVMKTTIQSLLDDNLWQTERLLADVKQISRRARFANMGDAEDKTRLLAAVTEAPKLHLRILELERSLEGLRKTFDTDGIDALSVNLTKEYELKIWILLYATRYTKHRMLELSPPVSRSASIGPYSSWISPVTKEQSEADAYSHYRRSWRDIDRETYEEHEKNDYVVMIAPTGDARRRKALFDYLRARFTWVDGKTDDALADQFADMHAEMHKDRGKAGLTPKELSLTGVTWTHAIAGEEDEETE